MKLVSFIKVVFSGLVKIVIVTVITVSVLIVFVEAIGLYLISQKDPTLWRKTFLYARQEYNFVSKFPPCRADKKNTPCEEAEKISSPINK